MNFLSNTLIVEVDTPTGNVLVSHPDRSIVPSALVTIRPEALETMESDEAAHFLGARLLLLMPAMREHFRTHIERLAASPDGKLD